MLCRHLTMGKHLPGHIHPPPLSRRQGLDTGCTHKGTTLYVATVLLMHEVITPTLPLLSQGRAFCKQGLQSLKEGAISTEMKLMIRQGPGLCAELAEVCFSKPCQNCSSGLGICSQPRLLSPGSEKAFPHPTLKLGILSYWRKKSLHYHPWAQN